MSVEKRPSPVARLYHTERWKRIKRLVIDRADGTCERCGNPITGRFIVHHKRVATPDNFFDVDNLQLLCIECHNFVTFVEGIKRPENEIYKIVDDPIDNLIDFPDSPPNKNISKHD